MNKPKSVKIETPIGSIESDSGNHLLDIGLYLYLWLNNQLKYSVSRAY